MESPHRQPRERAEADGVDVEGWGFCSALLRGSAKSFCDVTCRADAPLIADITASLTFACSQIVRANVSRYTGEEIRFRRDGNLVFILT